MTRFVIMAQRAEQAWHRLLSESGGASCRRYMRRKHKLAGILDEVGATEHKELAI